MSETKIKALQLVFPHGTTPSLMTSRMNETIYDMAKDLMLWLATKPVKKGIL